MGQWFQVTSPRLGAFMVLVEQGLVANTSSVFIGVGVDWRKWRKERAACRGLRIERHMACECGAYLGRVTLTTTGLCEACGASKWMQCARAMLPKSEAIAAALNKRRAKCCAHGAELQCMSVCGVEFTHAVPLGGWSPVPPEVRRLWFERVWHNAKARSK